MSIESYQQTLDFLYSFVDYSLTRNMRYSPDKFNLDRMIRFMRALGNPQDKYPTIHVAGTKGKGSTCAMITSILSEAGYKVGFYSSPHMVDFTERIKIGKTEISQQQLVHLVNEIKEIIYSMGNLTTFEITTALAFLFFRNENVDAAVIEVGMGGRLDATNIINPVISVITSISHDHIKFLGNTLEKIAIEKAGIMKNNKPVVIAPQKEKVMQILVNEANEKKAIPICVDHIYGYEIKDLSLSGQNIFITKKRLDHSANHSLPFEIHLSLLGRHQAENAITANCVIEELYKHGMTTSNEDVLRGFENVYWPGRFEVICQQPLIIIDSAHNPDSFRKLKATIADYVSDRKINFLFAASEDKAIKKMLGIIKPDVDQLIITKTSHPRAASISNIMAIAEELGYNNIKIGEFEEMFKYAQYITDERKVLIAAGSIFLAGAIQEYMANIGKSSKREL